MESLGGSESGSELGGGIASAEGLADDTEAFRAGFNEAEPKEKPDTPNDTGTEQQAISGPESNVELAAEASPKDLTDDTEAFGKAFHEANAEAKPEAEAEGTPEAKPAPEAEPTAKAEAQPEAAEPTPEAEPEADAEAEPVAEGQHEVQPTPEATPEANTEAEPDAKAEAQPEPTEPTPEAKSEADTEAEPEAEEQPEVQPESEAEPEAKAEAQPELAQPTPEATPEADTEAQPVAEGSPEVQPSPEAKPEADTEAQPEPAEPTPEAEPEAQPEVAGPLEGEERPSGPSLADRVDLSTRQQMELAQAEVARGARDFTDNNEAAQYGAEHWNKYTKQLPQTQAECIFDYTVEPPHRDGKPTYVPINGYLRTGDGWSLEIQRHIHEIDAALEGRPVPEDLVISRATNLGHLGVHPRKMAGLTFHEAGYLSASLGSTAEAFEHKEGVLHLRVPKGTPALWVESASEFGDEERELLVARGRNWRADRVILDPDSGKWHIFGAVLPEGDDK